jgi:simple sugar transport system permease protein
VLAYVVLALVIAIGGWLSVDGRQMSRFTGFTAEEELVALPTRLTLVGLAGVCLILAAAQWQRPGERSNLILGLAAGAGVLAFLVWTTRDTSLSLLAMLRESIIRATPLVLGALAGLWSERSGVINIAIEGMMLFGAFVAVAVTALTGSFASGLIAAMLGAGVMAAFHAVLSLRYRVDQIISGVTVNILAAGITRYLNLQLLTAGGLNAPGTMAVLTVPGLADVPVIGPLLFRHQPTVFLMFLLVAGTQMALFGTVWGLRTRAIGEHPRAADALGIPVNAMRYLNVVVGGLIAGIGGAYFSLGEVGRFEDGMTNGRGFVALAAMIFGKWTPLGSLAAGSLFGFADALQTKLQILAVGIPAEFLQMTPYVLTVIVLAGVIGRAIPPTALGRPYERERLG